ncbi:hypothetical protein H4J59_10110 [Colwellia sp. MB02u-10]|uniref:hypothetical protein n=1 Tax=Colwellia sp. MB02u-10 TaxID=2759828 RepID=UPI0015F5E761|nr:hypothetical protein [Colwellia sp. MB02u-10]MBA6341336.1 hypothetical protein [Colwellia sp. MB02u-10]
MAKNKTRLMISLSIISAKIKTPTAYALGVFYIQDEWSALMFPTKAKYRHPCRQCQDHMNVKAW